MDIANIITKHIDSNNYDDLTKVRWIYLFVCSLFSYDIRFVLEKNYNNDLGYNIDWNKLRDEIYYKKIDITNVKDFEIICYGIAKVLVDILSLYGFDTKIEKDPNKFMHVHVIVKVDDYYLKLDPMLRHDNTRVKLNFTTKDFVSLNDSINFDDRLKIIDAEIDYYNKDFLNIVGIEKIYNVTEAKFHYDENYNDIAIKKIASFLEDSSKENKETKEEKLIKKVEFISYLINDKKNLIRYDDIDFYMNYLFNNLLDKNELRLYRPSLFWNIDSDGNWNMTTIIMIILSNGPIFYRLKKEGNKYNMNTINYDELEDVFRHFEGINKEYIKYILNKNNIKLK